MRWWNTAHIDHSELIGIRRYMEVATNMANKQLPHCTPFARLRQFNSKDVKSRSVEIY